MESSFYSTVIVLDHLDYNAIKDIEKYTWSIYSNSSAELRVLFVADPQIQGNHNEPPVVGVFSRWDIDW